MHILLIMADHRHAHFSGARKEARVGFAYDFNQRLQSYRWRGASGTCVVYLCICVSY